VVGVAGGRRKTAAIRGALQGGWINVLITDRGTAERLLRTTASEPRNVQAGASDRPRRARSAHASGRSRT